MATGFGTFAESRAGRMGPINLGVKQTGERRAGNPHAAFEVAGAGNVAWSRCCDTRRRKSESTGNTNFDLNRRASLRPYLREVGVKVLDLLTRSDLNTTKRKAVGTWGQPRQRRACNDSKRRSATCWYPATTIHGRKWVTRSIAYWLAGP